MRFTLPIAKVGTGRNLGFVLLAWFVLLWWAAWAFPPLDSHPKPGPLVFWSFMILAVPLALLTVIFVLAYLYQSWLMLPTARNKIVYGLWLGFETLLLLGVPIWLAISFLTEILSR